MNLILEGPTEYLGLEIDKSHLEMKIEEAYEDPNMEAELKNVKCDAILKLLTEKKLKWNDHLVHGVDYAGNQVKRRVEKKRKKRKFIFLLI